MRTPRIAPLPVAAWGDEETGALRAYVGDAGVERFLSGAPDAPRVPNVLGTLLRHPRIAAKWLPYNGTLLDRGTIEPRLRELVILRVAARTGSEYEWLQHVRIGRKLGITADEVDAIRGACDRTWPALEADLLAATDELLDHHRVSDATWARLAETLAPRQLIELVFVVGSYACLAMVFESCGIELDPDLVDDPAPRIADRKT